MFKICGILNRSRLISKILLQPQTHLISVRIPLSGAIRSTIQPGWRCLHITNRGLLSNVRHNNRLVLRRMVTSKAGEKLTKSDKKSDIVRLLLLAKEQKWFILASIGCLVVSSTITMGVPYAIGRILDIIFTDNFSKEKLTNFCTILFGVFIIGGIANFGRIYLLNSASKSNARKYFEPE